MINILKILTVGAVSIALLTGCSTTHKATQSARTPIEQLLISEAAIRSASPTPERPLPIPKGANVILTTSGLNTDQVILQQVLTGWLGQQGYLVVQKDDKNATHRIDVIIGSLGTELSGTFIGMPPIQSTLIPFSLPELAFYKSQYQTGYAKFYMNIFEMPSGKFVGSTSPFLADAYYNDYTIFFIFAFTSTDLTSPPELGSLYRKPLNPPPSQNEYETKPRTVK
ncbi:hypothetical protein EBAPG3_011845 [Nitrosospira lacus]|uniref:Lipoprotein n=1 Tax=Nitrosospira lacus TaxID=1288494 RepID=A0A1W6SRG6_9PROT|nr:hypothetical protein [Nitrosospira lacus]ARO88408.1 hypothetical protein EBAPG3_011845 [Nitrosospira lacus]